MISLVLVVLVDSVISAIVGVSINVVVTESVCAASIEQTK